jgi:hypothetical protein
MTPTTTQRQLAYKQHILTPQGKIPITQIQEGQEVIGFNYETKQQELYVVAKKGPFGKGKSWIDDKGFHYKSHKNQTWIRINKKYNFAPHQSLYVNGNVFHAFEIKKGDALENDKGKKVIVKSVERTTSNAPKFLLVIEKKKSLKSLVKKFLNFGKSDRQYHTYYIDGILAHNASRYWVGGTATWDGTAGSKWAASSAGASGSSIPTAADDVFFDGLATGGGAAGAITVTLSSSVCRSFQHTASTTTISHPAATTLTIGDATAGAGNIAFKIASGTTYTLGSATTSAISFISTSATAQDVDFAGRTTGNVTYNATSNGSWKMTGAHNTGTGATINLTKGTLNVNGQTCSWGLFDSNNSNTRTLTLGAANITMTGAGGSFLPWTTRTATGMTLNAGTSTITCTGSVANFEPGGLTYYDLVFSGSSGVALFGNNFSCHSITRTGTVAKTDSISFTMSVTMSGTFTVNGNSAINRVEVKSSLAGTARTLTAATVSVTNADFRDITGAGAGSWNLSAVTGGSGDCGGNSGITFSTSATQTWSGTTGGNWSANAWTSRVPLPQDDVVINKSFSASQTITIDMPKLGRSIDWTGSTGTPTWADSLACEMFGNLTLISGMSISGSAGFNFSGRGSYTITSAGRVFTSSVGVGAVTGTYTLNDAFSCNGASGLLLNSGTFDAGTSNVTANLFQSSNSTVRSLKMGTGTWTLTGTGTVWNTSTITNLTITPGSSTIVISDISATGKTFQPGAVAVNNGKIYNNITISGGGAGSVIFGNAIQINKLTITGPKTVVFTAGTTSDIANLAAVGTAGNLITFQSSSSGSQFTLRSSSSVISCDYLSLQDSNASSPTTWYAGTHSTNVSGNTGWIFTAGASTSTITESAITLTESLKRATAQFPSGTITLTESLVKATSQFPSGSVSLTETLLKSITKATFTETPISLVESIKKAIGKTYLEQLPRVGLAFDGVQNYVDIGLLGSFMGGMTNDLYIAFTIRADPATGDIIYQRNIGGSSSQALRISMVNAGGYDTLVFTIYKGSGGWEYYINQTVLDGQIHLVEFVTQFNSFSKQAFVDGVAVPIVNQASNQPPPYVNFNANAAIGKGADGFGKFTLYNLKMGYSAVDLSVNYTLSEGQGTTLADSTGNGNTGTLAGSPLPVWIVDEPETLIKAVASTYTNTISLTETFLKAITKTPFVESVTLIESFRKAVSKAYNETVSLIETFSYQSAFFRSFTESISLTESLRRFTTKVAFSESISLVETFIKTVRKVFTENITLVEAFRKLFHVFGQRLFNRRTDLYTAKDKLYNKNRK